MKNINKLPLKSLSAMTLAIALATFGVQSANAQSSTGLVNGQVKIQTGADGQDERGRKTNDTSINGTTSTEVRVDSSANASSGKSENHRGTVAVYVRSLLDTANRDGGIGSQVSEVAMSQNEAASTTSFAMTKVEARGSVRTFFFGSDYRNLGVIRSSLATTEKNISKLQNALTATSDASVRAELSAEIKALQDENAKVEAYVKAHEDVFSLFGWFTKWFSK